MEARTNGRRRVWRRLLQVGVFALALAAPAMAHAAVQSHAVVSSAGVLVRGVGATGALHLGTGTYQVNFSTNMSRCGYIATPGDTGAGAVLSPAVATVATR